MSLPEGRQWRKFCAGDAFRERGCLGNTSGGLICFEGYFEFLKGLHNFIAFLAYVILNTRTSYICLMSLVYTYKMMESLGYDIEL